MAEFSPAEVTVAQIAMRAGVNETTIYRKWGSKDALYRDVLLTLSSEQLEMTDTGSLRGDLLQVVSGVATFLRTPAGYSLAYLGATGEDATTAALRDAFWADRFAKAQVIFDRAVERGEIADASVAELAYEALIGTMHFRILARRRPLADDIAERLVDLVLDGVLSASTESRTPG
ncbi:TetR family transcriptional regulator [Amycolatopsis deserti]|uniref:TetR family transcriptional regulator n=1 Tax=Amycolatopsis deserti TaxID=185696 RepID=A0ABQ3IC89_9PSEU|nr:TetR family transcriptional regulator [Amycolatopsis deserti]